MDPSLGLSKGDRVSFVDSSGSYANYALVSASKAIPVPDDVDLETAAAVSLQALTAHYLVSSTYPIQRGDTVLIHAGAGGTGALLIQMAKLRGARYHSSP